MSEEFFTSMAKLYMTMPNPKRFYNEIESYHRYNLISDKLWNEFYRKCFPKVKSK